MGFARCGIETRELRGIGQHIELVLVKDRRWRVREAPGRGPGDGVGARQIARPTELDRQQVGVAVAAHHDDRVAALDGLRNGVHAEPGGLPDRLSGFDVVRVHPFAGADDDLLPAGMLEHQRCRPVGLLFARRAPQFLPGRRIQRRQERSLFVIEQRVQAAVIQDDGGALTELEAHVHRHAEVFLPDLLAVDVVGEQAARTEERVHTRAVGDGGVGREAAVNPVIAFVRHGGRSRPLPVRLSGLTIDRHDHEAVFDAGTGSPAWSATALGCLDLSGRNRRRHEDAIAGDDWARKPASRDLDLPPDVRLVIPLQRCVSGGHAGVRRAAPLTPFVRHVHALCGQCRHDHDTQAEGHEPSGTRHRLLLLVEVSVTRLLGETLAAVHGGLAEFYPVFSFAAAERPPVISTLPW